MTSGKDTRTQEYINMHIERYPLSSFQPKIKMMHMIGCIVSVLPQMWFVNPDINKHRH